MQKQPQSSELPQPPPSPLLDHLESQLSSINQEELDSMLNTLSKFKTIFKKGKLTSYKKLKPKANRAFGEMSSFFHFHRSARQHTKATTKTQRIKQREQRQSSEVNQRQLRKWIAKKQKIIQKQRQQQGFTPEYHQGQSIKGSGTQLRCHICRLKYTEIDAFYGYFCPPCAALNACKRTQSANLSGLTALVTGGRIKIGFQICLKLLRDGATVYVTSRFANDAVLRYQSQKDYRQWSDRLFIVQCDFLSQKQVHHLITYIKQNVAKLDILINNAAQTIVRPKEFYTKELQHARLMIQNDKEDHPISVVRSEDNCPFPSVTANEIAIGPEEVDLTELDEFGQPTDKRAQNSWVQPIEDVSLLDCYTTQVINSIVPFHLISQLKEKMKGATPSWVVNVSSMEGVFDRPFKSHFHPHTNMAKAALNMITRTSACQFAAEGIFITSVDTGWVTNENPYGRAKQMSEKHYFKCPLDCVDGAMRVLDPIYLGVLKSEFPFGQFLKNYKPSQW